MRRMKADSKAIPKIRRVELDTGNQVLRYRAMTVSLVMWTGALCLCADLALAKLVRQSVPVDIALVGGFCDHVPHKHLPAPGVAKGKVEFDHHGLAFVRFGDRLTLEKGLGFGLQARVAGFGPGDKVAVQISDPAGVVSKWDYEIPGAGVFQMGLLPAPGGTMLPGLYRFSAYGAGHELFAYDMVIVGPAEFGSCDPAPSTS